MKLYTDAKGNKVEKICPQYHSRFCFNECQWFGNCPDQERGDSLPDNMGVCSNCGRIGNRYLMEEINTGRKAQRLCIECYKAGVYFVKGRSIDRVNHLAMEKERTKRK